GVLGQLVKIATGFPVARRGLGCGLGNQRLQPLSGSWVAIVVQSVEFKCGFNGPDVAFGLGDACLGWCSHDADCNETGEDSQDDDRHHDFYKREAALAPQVIWCSVSDFSWQR